MMNLLLINPAYPNTFWSFKYALKFIGKKAAFPPLGLLTVAAMLPGQFQTRLVDVNVEDLKEADLAWAQMVFISAMAIQRASAKNIIGRCRSHGLKVVAGGPLFTSEPEAFPEVDHLVLDEAELTLPSFLADLQDDQPKKIYRAGGFCHLGQTPIPDWGLVRMKNYASMCIQFSRGCPFNCDFCNVTALFGHRVRMKTPLQVLAELDRLYAAGWRGNIFFVDDNFIGNRAFLKAHLLPALMAWRQTRKGCVFYTEASINLADDPELMEMMVRAGFDLVFIGIESPDEQSLAECKKNQNKNRDLLRSVRTIQQAGLQVSGGFIVGFDCDTPATFQRHIDFIQQSGIVTAMVGMLQAPPGTLLFERLQKENRVVGQISGDNVDGTTNIVPKMGLSTLVEGYQTIMAHIYSPRHYYQRVRTLLREFGNPHAKAPMDFQRCLAFFKTCLRLGIIGRERLHYWYLLLWTLIRKPRQLPLAITLTIYGHHFRRICERNIFGIGSQR
ncbi:B12-binding domain-containing radical SAM protein [Desulfosarcina sp.]|uniref:B12-binding domain-containing radical SAM protein n=1 Tax=Desulfosarcina sp. TaxID=2027861 RepID=UPI0039710408